MQPTLVFDDGGGVLDPLTDLRASFDVRTGGRTTLERLRRRPELAVRALVVRDALQELCRERHDLPVNPESIQPGEWLVVNGRCPLLPAEALQLRDGQVLIERETGDVIAACLGSAAALALARGQEVAAQRIELDRHVLLSRPWHVRTFRDAALEADLAAATGGGGDGSGASGRWEGRVEVDGVYRLGRGPMVVDATARVYPGVTLDGECGAIVVEGGAVLRPGAVVIGPAWIGAGATVLERAVVRGGSVVGPVCKVGGEVSGTVFQGYSNKAHDGYLGDSWVGEWVNLGAGTTNSNLLNTYGPVHATAAPGRSREATGCMFLGAIIGDHVKTAIGTRIMTGAVVGTGVMWAASVAMSGAVERLAWVTDGGERRYEAEKFVQVARAMMARRGMEPSAAYAARLRALFAGAARAGRRRGAG